MGINVPGTAMRTELPKPVPILEKALPNLSRVGLNWPKFHQPPMISGIGRKLAMRRPTKGNSHAIARAQAKT